MKLYILSILRRKLGSSCSTDKYSNILRKLYAELFTRFKYLKKAGKYVLLTYPFSFDVGKAPDNIRLKLTVLQSVNGLKGKLVFGEVSRSLSLGRGELGCYVIPNTAISKTM
jgi:hypothetical protein